jgi:hypothetical protein
MENVEEKVFIPPSSSSSSYAPAAAAALLLRRGHRRCHNVEIPPKIRNKQKQNETHYENITH